MSLDPETGRFFLEDASNLFQSTLQKCPYVSKNFQSYVGLETPNQSSISLIELKHEVEILITEFQKAKLRIDPRELFFNLAGLHSK